MGAMPFGRSIRPGRPCITDRRCIATGAESIAATGRSYGFRPPSSVGAPHGRDALPWEPAASPHPIPPRPGRCYDSRPRKGPATPGG